MRIRTKLLFLVVLLGLALLVNLLALGYLARTVTTALKTVEEVSIRQQLTALQMHAQLRDAEAALYRYLMEGETGFAAQFEEQLHNFELDVAIYQTLATSEEERAWAAELVVAHHDAVEVGEELIHLRDQQTADLQELEAAQIVLTALLTGPVRAARPTDMVYQEAVGGMHANLREILLAVTGYLASPESAERVRFTEAAVGFHHDHKRFSALATTDKEHAWAEALSQSFTGIQALGSRLISGRDQQQAQFANFAAILFRTSQGVLVGEIQPRAAENLAQAQQQLLTALNFAVAASLITAVSVSIVAAAVTLPLLRQMGASILALLHGADRVATGDLTEPVRVAGRDELSRLAEAFNAMMAELASRERHLKARLSELEALRQISLQLTSTLDLNRVMDTIASSTQSLVGAREVHIFMCDDTGANPQFAASAWRDEAGHPPLRTPRTDGLIATVVRRREPQVVNRADQHPLFDTPEARQWGIKAAAGLPLKLGEQVLGVFSLSFDDRHTFSEDELRILGLLADQAAVALYNARLYQGLAEKEARLHTLAKKLAHVQEEERRLVGLDLHDGLTQLLLSTNMHLDTLASLSNDLDRQTREELATARADLREAIEEARRVVSELRPAALEDLGLVDGLRHYLLGLRETRNWQIEFVADPGDIKPGSAVETTVFRIAQEALTNAHKHGRTTRVRVVLQASDMDLSLEVRDWGCGFDVAMHQEESERLGLIAMHERAALLGGECCVESQPGHGTRVLVRIPLSETSTPDET